MAKLTLRTPWTSQPQVSTGIDWSNPLSRGLVALVDRQRQIVTNVRRSAGTSVATVGPSGVSDNCVGAYSQFAFDRSRFTNQCTYFAFYDKTATGANSFVFGDVQGAGVGYNAGLYDNSTNFSFFIKTGGTGTAVASTSTSGATNNVKHGGTYDGANMAVYINGRKEATTAKTGNIDAGAFELNINRWNSLNPHSTRFYLGFVWNRALSEAEMKSLSANPWQLFQPIQRTIWVPAAAGGGGSTLLPSSITSSEAFGTHVLSAGLVNLSPTAIASAEAFGSHTLSSIVALAPSGIATAEAFGTHVITVGNVTISPSGISSGEVFGSHIISQAGGTQTVLVNGIPSDEAFGSHLINAGTIIVTPTGIASQEGFGTASLLTGTVVIFPSGIPSGELFGIPALVGGTPSGATTVFYVRGFSSYGQRRNR